MAIDKHGDEILTSIHGRRMGLDHDNFLVGVSGVRSPYESSTATGSLETFGLSALSGAAATFLLGAPPAVGVTKTIVNASTVSTATMSVLRESSGSGVTFASSLAGAVQLNLIGYGTAVDLIGISDTVWAIKSGPSSSGYLTISTSS